MRLKTVLPAALAGLVLGFLATPAIVKATTDNDLARRSWIHTLNTELKAGIDYEKVKDNSITAALFGVADVACTNPSAAFTLARSLMNETQTTYALKRFNERYCAVKNS